MQQPLPGMVVWAGALVLIGSVGSCTADPTLPEPGSEIVVDLTHSLDRWPQDVWDFDNAMVVDGALELDVAYGGGCEEHDFWLVAVHGWREIPTAGPTTTAAIPILLAHDAHGDACEAYVTETRSFSLQPLVRAFDAQFGRRLGRVILRVPLGQGAQDTLSVEFLIQ